MLLGPWLGGNAAAFPSGGALPPVLTLVIPVAGLNGVPVDAAGVAMNVTVTAPAAPGFLTVYPCGDTPLASNLNYVHDQTVPNFVISGLSPDGDVCIDTSAVVDVVVDLAGYIPSGSPIVTLPEPARIVDSRQGIGVPGPMKAGDVAEVQVAGVSGVPLDASIVLFNATVANTGSPGFLTVFPCGEPIPPTSTLNFASNAVVPNFVVAKIGSSGRVCLYSMAPTDVIIDVAGFVPAGATDIVPLPSPARLLDTRTGTGGPQAMLTPNGRALQITGAAGIPDTAKAVIVNLTATQSSGSGFVSAFPCGGAAPLVSNLNFSTGTNVANMAIVRLGSAGQLCLRSNVDVDVIADVTGYLNNDAAITALTPVRIYDSREGVDPPCNLGVRFAPNGFEIVDLTTGNVIGLAPSSALQAPRMHVNSDCQHIDVVGSAPTLSQNLWLEFDKSGTLIASQPIPDHPSNVIFTDQEPLILQYVFLNPASPYWQVIDLSSGQVMFTLPALTNTASGGLRSWQPVGATLDGGLIALQNLTPDLQNTVISYWTPDGLPLGEWLSPTGAFNVRLSPSGTYLAYDARSIGSVSPNGFVVALDGSLVATMPRTPGLLTIGPWLTDGSMLGCLPNGADQRTVRWDLFSPVKDLIPGNPYKSCLVVAG